MGRQKGTGEQKPVHDLIDQIQEENTYAHLSGDFSRKTAHQNRLLERHAAGLDVSWDGDARILIELQGRSAGHLPVHMLTPDARRAIAARLGLDQRDRKR